MDENALFSIEFNWHDFIAGWVGGVAGLLVGHPADTIKVRQQTYSTTLWPAIKQTFVHEGYFGFYRGLLFPLLTTGPQSAIFFGFYGNCLQYLQETKHSQVRKDDPNWQLKVYIAGCFGGLATVISTCPVEVVKVVLQVNTEGKKTFGRKDVNIDKSMMTCVKNIYKERGFFGFYRGFVPMLWRDVPSYGVFTCGYEVMMHYVFYPGLMGDVGRQIFSGGTAGVLSWIFFMPFDVAKSRMQADNLKNHTYKGFIDCLSKSYRCEGLLVFNKGIFITCLRAFPVNAATFVGYEAILRVTHQYS